MDKNYVYMYNGILLSHKKAWALAICNNMVGSTGFNAKWSKSEKQVLYDFICTWNLKNKTNEQRKKDKAGGC